jgi:serine-type D-Ala-D-Ala carboxypeptidase (penicillin-binding protein 5/6)
MNIVGFLSLFASLLFGIQHVANISDIPDVINSPEVQQQQYFIPTSLNAEGVLLIDPTKNDSYVSRNNKKYFPIASLTKIMTAYVALEHLGPRTEIRVSKDAVKTEGAAGQLYVGEIFSLKDLITIMMVESSNDAASAIAEHLGRMLGAKSYKDSIIVFVNLLNQSAKELGMHQSIFQNPTGLDLKGKSPSNYATANDLAILVGESMKYPVIWESTRLSGISITSINGIRHTIHNTNTLAFRIPNLIGSKTGTTDSANEALIILYEFPLGTPLALILLNADPGTRIQNALDFLRANGMIS